MASVTSTPLKPATASGPVVYPDSDAQPMADNTVQYRWIVTIKGNLDLVFADALDVFVAGDLLWYPVEGDPTIRQAPDVFVAFGRPKGDRGSYRQWEEGGIAPQVVFEIASPDNRAGQWTRKFAFYEWHGVEEYYIYDPDAAELTGYRRESERLVEIQQMRGWVSPRLQCRFDIVDGELEITTLAGRRFVSFEELGRMRDDLERQVARAHQTVEQLREQLRKHGIEPQS